MDNGIVSRKLEPSDFDRVRELVRSRAKFVGINPSELEFHRAISEEAIRFQLSTSQSVGSVIGVEIDGDLVGVSCTSLGNSQPCWYLSKIYTRGDQGISTVSALFDSTVSFYEARGLYRFYTLSSADHLRAYGKILGDSDLHRSYMVYTDLIVEPNERTEYLDYWDHLYNRIPCGYRTAVRGFVKGGRE